MKAEFFTIAICTYNRATVIEHSIKSVLSQTASRSNYEILIIDNNCTDNTVEIVNKYSSMNDNIRLVNEQNQGLSYSRNRAIEEARGEIIVFIDDDAEMCPDYLNNLKKVFDEEKNIGAAGGPVEVGWLEPVPSWYETGLARAFNYLYYGSFRMKLKYPRMIFGTNMAFPLSLLKKMGGFRTGIGSIGEQSLSSGEMKMFHRIDKNERERLDITGYAESDIEILLQIEKKEGLPILYDPLLKVRHLISPERLTPEYILTKALWQGRSQYRLESHYGIKGGVRNALWCLFESYARIALGKSGGRLTERFQRALARGIVKEWLHGEK